MDKYLNEDAITAEIMSYVKNRIYNYAVLIDGDWGTGKTYFIQKSIIPTLEGSGYMPIYISLYGVNSTDTVSQKIALSILTNKLPSDKRTVAKQCLPAIGSFVLPIGQTLLNATGISILEPLFKSPVEDIPWDTIFKKFNDSRKRIFIFDDLERCSIVQIKRNPDTSTESIADQQPSTYPQHLYKYVSLTTAVQISRLFDILMSHRLYFPRYTELNDPLEGAAIDIPVGGYAGSSIYKQEDREDPFIGGLKAQYRILSLSDDPCSPQLWAHYAGNYTGACLCFRTDGKFSSAKKVQYFQRKPKPKTETMENQLEPSVEDCKKMVYSNWFLKQKGWEYEREWRIVEESTSNYFDYNPGELVGIILGTNLDSHIGDAIKHCVPSSVRILKAWPGQRTFEILITDGEYQKLGDGSPIPKITDIDSFLSSNV